MTHKFLILMTALAFAGAVGETRANSTTAEPTATESATEVEPFTEKQLEKGITKDEYGTVKASSKLLAKTDIARYRKYGLTQIESLVPFVVGSNEKIILKNPDAVNGGLNNIRFDGWGEKEWLNNNYIRSVRLYIDAYLLDLVKNEAFDKRKSAMKGKFAIYEILPFPGGGAWLQIVFVKDTSFSLGFWVYSYVGDGIEGYDIRATDLFDKPLGITSKDLKEDLK